MPEKIIRFIQGFDKGLHGRVLHEGDMKEPFDMKTGLCQGCLLSPLLFLLTQQAFGDNKTGIQFTLEADIEDLDIADLLMIWFC